MSLASYVWDHAIQSVENFGNFGKIQVMRTWAAWQYSQCENLSCCCCWLVVIHTTRTTISIIHTMRTWSAYRYFYYLFIYTIREQHFAMFTPWEPWAASVYTLIGCVQYLIALELLFPSRGKFQWPFSPWILLFNVVFHGLVNIVDFCVVQFVDFTDLEFL